MAGQIGEKIGSCSFLAIVAIFIILLMGDIFGEQTGRAALISKSLNVSLVLNELQ